MNLRTLMFLGVAGFIATPALSQTPAPTPAVPASTMASVDSLLASGYEVKSVIELSNASMTALFPGQTVAPQVVFTLQKGNSVAVCEMGVANWVSLVDGSMRDATTCLKR